MSSPSNQPHPNADVRMRGFVDRVSVKEALAWLDKKLVSQPKLPTETISLEHAAGRVLAESVESQVNVPDFERAMMDGFAVRSKDLQGASNESPVILDIVGECFPGQAFCQDVPTGTAVRIMTGAPMPQGTDAVLPVERTQYTESKVQAFVELPPGKNFGCVGEDISKGDTLFLAGRILRPQDVGVLSSIGQAQISVKREPRVRIVVTGDELLPSGTMPQGCQIVDSNGPMLAALIARDGGQSNHPGIVPDNRDAILAALRDDADIILCSGGSSVGQEDHVPTLLAEFGELDIHGIAMRPAGPLGMGVLEDKIVILLPGNPVACLWGYDLFASRAIRSLAGLEPEWPYRQIQCTVVKEIKSPVGRLDYVRVLHQQNESVEPVKASGASVLSSTTKADGFVVVPSECPGYNIGDSVEVFLYD